jgi:hypothetical protein
VGALAAIEQVKQYEARWLSAADCGDAADHRVEKR